MDARIASGFGRDHDDDFSIGESLDGPLGVVDGDRHQPGLVGAGTQ